jgi:hypothetical protein
VIKLGSEGATDVTTNGVHLHHYLWGMILVLGVGFFELVDRSDVPASGWASRWGSVSG